MWECEACLDRVHAVHTRGLEDRVVRLVGGIENAVWQVLAAHQDAMKIALCAAVGNVSPVLVLVNLPQARKPLQDPDLRTNNNLSSKVLADRSSTNVQITAGPRSAQE